MKRGEHFNFAFALICWSVFCWATAVVVYALTKSIPLFNDLYSWLICTIASVVGIPRAVAEKRTSLSFFLAVFLIAAIVLCNQACGYFEWLAHRFDDELFFLRFLIYWFSALLATLVSFCVWNAWFRKGSS